LLRILIGCFSNSIYHCLCIQRRLIKSVVLPDPPSTLYNVSFKTSWHLFSLDSPFSSLVQPLTIRHL
jgi:hypothetical protein